MCLKKAVNATIKCLYTLELATASKPLKVATRTYEVLHQIAEQLQRRSMILFTDLFQSDIETSSYLKR